MLWYKFSSVLWCCWLRDKSDKKGINVLQQLPQEA